MRCALVLAIVLYFSACDNPPPKVSDRKDGYTVELKTKVDSLYHEVMHGHDVGMAKMGRLKKHLKQIQAELDSLNKLPAKKVNKNYQSALIDLQEDLNYADYSMFTWMGEFRADSAKDDEKKRVAYLESEKIKVQQVKENILTGLQRADSILKR